MVTPLSLECGGRENCQTSVLGPVGVVVQLLTSTLRIQTNDPAIIPRKIQKWTPPPPPLFALLLDALLG